MFSQYYQAELSFLREMGREFALANPSLAHAFADKGGDPDVERLLEGFAFLSARIRERAEDAFPELVGALAEMAMPQILRPLPAATVMELTPKRGMLRGRHRLETGTPFASRPVDGVRCPFRTVEPVDLLPLTLERAALDERSSRAPEIRLTFALDEHGAQAVFAPGGLRLFLSGPWGLTATLATWLRRHVTGARVETGDGTVHLGARGVRPHVRDGALGLVPWPELAPDDARRLGEHFALPSSHLFFDVEGLERVPADRVGDSFDLVLRFETPPPLPERLGKDVFRLHCVPAVNLFETDAEPIRVDPKRPEYRLQASGLGVRGAEVFEVRSVTGLRPGRRGRRDYRALYAPALDHGDGAPPRYALRRARSPIDGALDTYLSLADRTEALASGDESLSVELVCTNRQLTAGLRVGDVCEALPASPSVATFHNVTGVSKPVTPAVGRALQWRLLRQLALSHRSLADAASLRAVLSEHNAQRDVDGPLGRANDRRIESIRDVRSRPVTRVIGGVALRGVETTVEVDEAGFAGTGDIDLFGCALDDLFAARLPINTFHALRIHLHPSLGELTWAPRTGTQTLL